MLAAFSLQATAVAGAELLAGVTGDGLAGAGDDPVLGGLRVTAVPGGLVFGVLVAAVVGSEFGWATERALLARDPRRLRFAGYQLAVAAVLAWPGGPSRACSRSRWGPCSRRAGASTPAPPGTTPPTGPP